MENIIKNCGPGGNLQDLENISSDPNFIFQNDPDFATLTLYDLEGNVINVSSWLECANYVNGGWSIENLDNYNGELVIFAITLSIIGIFWAIKKLKKANAF